MQKKKDYLWKTCNPVTQSKQMRYHHHKLIISQKLKKVVIFLKNAGSCKVCPRMWLFPFSPFGVEQVPDLLVVYLHVGDLHSEALSLLSFLHSPAEQRATEARDQTRVLCRAHHGVRLPWAWRSECVTESENREREKRHDVREKNQTHI